jgi:hypothetical protein
MRSLDLSEARDVSERAARGDAEAISFLSSLFPDTELCFLCDQAVGATGSCSMFPDPRSPGMMIVAAECLACARSPNRQRRELAMARAMWPKSRFRAPKDIQPNYLRGPRVKKRH